MNIRTIFISKPFQYLPNACALAKGFTLFLVGSYYQNKILGVSMINFKLFRYVIIEIHLCVKLTLKAPTQFNILISFARYIVCVIHTYVKTILYYRT